MQMFVRIWFIGPTTPLMNSLKSTSLLPSTSKILKRVAISLASILTPKSLIALVNSY